MARKAKVSRIKRLLTPQQRAEQIIQSKPKDGSSLPTRDVQELLRDLTMQIKELEARNDELCQNQAELAEDRDSYADLYEYAPLGYVTLNRNGDILKANLTSAAMLGVDRQLLQESNILKFVPREYSNDCSLHLKKTVAGKTKQIAEIEMIKGDGSRLAVRMETTAYSSGRKRYLRTTLINISEKKRVERELHSLNEELERRVAEQTDRISMPVTIWTGQDRILYLSTKPCVA